MQTNGKPILTSEDLLRTLGIKVIPFSIVERQRIVDILRQTAVSLRSLILEKSPASLQQQLITTIDADPKFTEDFLAKIQKTTRFSVLIRLSSEYFIRLVTQSTKLQVDPIHPYPVTYSDTTFDTGASEPTITTKEQLNKLHERIAKHMAEVFQSFLHSCLFYFVHFLRKKRNKNWRLK